MMTQANDRIDNLSLFFLIIAIIVETGLLLAPRILVQAAGAGAWLSVAMALLPLACASFFMARLGQLFPNEPFSSYCGKIVGKWPGILLNFFFTGYWIVNNGRILRNFSDIIKTSLLFRTPLEVVMLSFLIPAAYLARCGIKTLARFAVIAVIISIPIGGLLVFASYQAWNFSNLLPWMEKGWLKTALAGFFIVGQSEGLESILFLLPFLKRPQKALPYTLAATAFTLSLMFMMVSATLLEFGASYTLRLAVPGITLIQSVELPSHFLERLGSIYMAIWILIVFPTVAAFLYLPSIVLAGTLKMPEPRPFVLLLLPIVYLTAILPPDITAVFKLSEMIKWFNMVAILVLPAILFVIAKLRGYKPGGNP
ncbi:MAG: endospore germination permease [Firmicutes bacterium]|nr:endospore germination permease [Bacillota bacterium]